MPPLTEQQDSDVPEGPTDTLLCDILPLSGPSSRHLCDRFSEMLRLVAYDIADPRRLRRVAIACEDFGIRVQKSLFECWLEEDRFNRLWERLTGIIDPQADSLAAYVLEAPSAARRRAAGCHVPTNRRLTLIF